jgi:ubiquitin-activating enzyme E1 C
MLCQADLFPPPVVFQECTVVSFPRQPAHCVIWAKEHRWQEVRGAEEIDGDNEEHIDWIFAEAQKHAEKFKIEGLTRSLTKGVVKNIIPAIAALQAVIAAMSATEALKLVTGAGPNANNNLGFSADNGAYMNHYFVQKKPGCPACSRKLNVVPAVEGETVAELLKRLAKDFDFPATSIRASDTIYMPIVAATHANLSKPVTDFVGPGDTVAATSKERQEAFEFVIDGLK